MTSFKLLVITDRPPSKSIRQIISENPVDVIVTLGDLELSEIRELEMITNIPKIGVYGNHCSGAYMEELGITNIHEGFSSGGYFCGTLSTLWCK